ncbi:MAG: hypothetical protein HY819_21865 [Acidobacteria bacterium]|nr:hypothetical protein [Acidobacteriota bacterium]
MSASKDFIEVNVLPLPDGQENAFCIELQVQDSDLNPQPFTIILGFQMENAITGLNLNEDAINQPEIAFSLAKDLLYCGSDEIPLLTDLPPDEALAGKIGYYYFIDTEMEFDNLGKKEEKMQRWHVSIFLSSIERNLDKQDLFRMIKNLFNLINAPK